MNESKNDLTFTFTAIDGSMHEILYQDGNVGYIVIGKVIGEVSEGKILIRKIDYTEELCENCNVEERMKVLEYEEADKSDSDIIFLDRMISKDGYVNKNNVIAIIKDPSKRINIEAKTPWLVPIYEGKVRGAYFKIFPFSWVFLVETTFEKGWNEILSILYMLSQEPIPEALGYNYPLFLADKVAKFYRDKMIKGLDLVVSKFPQKYRQFRSKIERNRRKGNGIIP